MLEFKIKGKETPNTFNLALLSLRIVFIGTPEFAVASLDALVNAGYNIVGVITAPDKPAGRGMKMHESAVKQYALQHNLNILQPEKLKNPLFLEQLKALKADLQIVVAFRMLPEAVWNMPRLGTINLHGSLLPQYRGAAPINWAVINGEKETGVTTFKLQHAIDTGNILMQESFPIDENETAGDVHDKMKEIGAKLLVKTVNGLASGNLKEMPQDVSLNSQHITLQHAPKIYTETCKIDFSKTTEEVHNLIRGLSPFPGAFTYLDNKVFKIFKSEKDALPDGQTETVRPNELNLIAGETETIRPGELKTDGKTFLKFACADGYVNVLEVQLEGKKKLSTREFLKGYHFE